ncbi:hypothetical protein B0H10DRAFT_1949347 [Mycena sp. CBHHK59/15]|nr:hypothetical protein B0H10DRAFT_1949347 [Mycena sp. CBHHK59/15]
MVGIRQLLPLAFVVSALRMGQEDLGLSAPDRIHVHLCFSTLAIRQKAYQTCDVSVNVAEVLGSDKGKEERMVEREEEAEEGRNKVLSMSTISPYLPGKKEIEGAENLWLSPVLEGTIRG